MDDHGEEWLIDAYGCDEARLRNGEVLRAIAAEIVDTLGLTLVGRPMWHQFPGPGGWTGLYLLSESHLTCHTFPETGVATWNLYCCRPRSRWDWETRLARELGASEVRVRRLSRGERPAGQEAPSQQAAIEEAPHELPPKERPTSELSDNSKWHVVAQGDA